MWFSGWLHPAQPLGFDALFAGQDLFQGVRVYPKVLGGFMGKPGDAVDPGVEDGFAITDPGDFRADQGFDLPLHILIAGFPPIFEILSDEFRLHRPQDIAVDEGGVEDEIVLELVIDAGAFSRVKFIPFIGEVILPQNLEFGCFGFQRTIFKVQPHFATIQSCEGVDCGRGRGRDCGGPIQRRLGFFDRLLGLGCGIGTYQVLAAVNRRGSRVRPAGRQQKGYQEKDAKQ